jgi:hypothetical protein
VKGGHARSGPAPDPEALRRDRPNDPGWIVLPVTGRPGPPAPWPLETKPTPRQGWHWARLWAMPQAVQWERLGLAMSLAVYVLRLCEVEQTGASASLGNHVLRLEENLGLTLAGMRMLRWQIGGEQAQSLPKAAGGETPTASPRRPSARDRMLTVVPDGDV